VTDKHRRFKQRLEQLNEIIMGGLGCYSVWNKLRLRDPSEVDWSLERQNEILGRWLGFFTIVVAALQQMAMLEFAKVFDTDPRTVSLIVLLDEAKRDRSLVPNADDAELAAISEKIQEAETTRETIRQLRNQRLAHADAYPGQLPELMNHSVESLAENIQDAFNRLSRAHDQSTYSWAHALRTSSSHTFEILRILSKEIEHTQTEFNSRMVEMALGEVERMEGTLGRPLEAGELDFVIKPFGLSEGQAERVRQARLL